MARELASPAHLRATDSASVAYPAAYPGLHGLRLRSDHFLILLVAGVRNRTGDLRIMISYQLKSQDCRHLQITAEGVR